MSRIALACYPRSGSTWLRMLLEDATGQRCGSIYDDIFFDRNGQNGIVIKTHKREAHEFTGAIHLVRNPFEAIESYYHFARDFGGATDLTWDKHVHTQGLWWRDHTRHWLDAPYKTCVIWYEELHVTPHHQLQRACKYLGLPLSGDDLEDAVDGCTIERLRARAGGGERVSQFFRRGTCCNDPLKVFSRKQVDYVEQLTCDVRQESSQRIFESE